MFHRARSSSLVHGDKPRLTSALVLHSRLSRDPSNENSCRSCCRVPITFCAESSSFKHGTLDPTTLGDKFVPGIDDIKSQYGAVR